MRFAVTGTRTLSFSTDCGKVEKYFTPIAFAGSGNP